MKDYRIVEVVAFYICRPIEDVNTLVGFVKDRLAGASGPHLHWVAHQCDKETMVKLHTPLNSALVNSETCFLQLLCMQNMLSQLASDTGGQFHSYSKSNGTEMQVDDTDIQILVAQLKE